MFKLDWERAKEPEIKWPTSIGSSKKWESSRKTSTSALLTMPKPLTVWITTNYGKLLKRWEYQTSWPASWEICMQGQEATVRTGHGTTDWFQIGKGVHSKLIRQELEVVWPNIMVTGMCVLVTQLCPTPCDCMDYGLPGCSVHAIH